MKIYDCFTYDGEECLDLRLRAHWDRVDVFVIVEGGVTFSGLPKSLTFDPVRHAWAGSKIRYVPLDAAEFAACETSWERERLQRNALRRGYADAAADDLVIIADVDEVIRPACMTAAAPGELRVFEQLMLYFYCDYLQVSEPFWCKAVAVSGATALQHSPEDLRNSKVLRQTLRETRVPDAGWHFSYLGGMDVIEKKLERFSHQNLNKPRYRDRERNLARLYAGKDIYRRARRWGRVNMGRSGFTDPVVQNWFDQRPALWAPKDIRFAGELQLVLEAARRQSKALRAWHKFWLRLWNAF
jgi:beta-1,4-mannosyl-glycoprotein beta-1,4-N-acetylglucosaminyltransferase